MELVQQVLQVSVVVVRLRDQEAYSVTSGFLPTYDVVGRIYYIVL